MEGFSGSDLMSGHYSDKVLTLLSVVLTGGYPKEGANG